MDATRLRELIEAEKNDKYGVEYEILEEIADILKRNLTETMQFMDFCTQEEFLWISSVFDEVSEKYQSQEFIDCLRRNQLRFPEIHDEIEQEIQNAILMMHN